VGIVAVHRKIGEIGEQKSHGEESTGSPGKSRSSITGSEFTPRGSGRICKVI
jgi:hypothetical protein